MKKFYESTPRFDVRTLQKSYRSIKRIGRLHRIANLGLLRNQFMPMDDLDLMSFYMQRVTDLSNETPDEVVKLIEQLSNMEEKVNALEELLGGIQQRNVNVLSVKENYEDEPNADPTATKIKRKQRKKCLCIPWGYSRETSEPLKKKKIVKKDIKHRGVKSGASHSKEEQRSNTRVSWDDDITVRYIRSNEHLVGSNFNKKKDKTYRSDEDSPNRSPDREGVKDVVHVKIRIPKKNNESANVIEITGPSIEEDEEADEFNKEVNSLAMVQVKKSEGLVENFTTVPENIVSVGKTDVGTTYELIASNDDMIEMKSSLYVQEALENVSKSDPKQDSTGPTITSMTSLDSKKILECIGIPSRRAIETSTVSPMDMPLIPEKDDSLAEVRMDKKPAEDPANTDIITMVGQSNKVSEYETIGIPVKEPGRRTCGSLGCGCRGSTKNDNNLFELRNSLRSDVSSLSLLGETVGKSLVPEVISVDTNAGVVNVVTHHSTCNCAICLTFGSKRKDSHRNSIRSDTGAVVSKRVIRVRYNEDFRNVVTHTEECGCSICIGIDDQIFKDRFLKSTEISTKDSILLVQNKGICGCTDCKTITNMPKPSEDTDDSKDYSDGLKSPMNAMISKTSYRSVDPCYYSDATVPSNNSFPLKRSIVHQKPEITTPSNDSLDSSDGQGIHSKTTRNYDSLLVNPAMKQVKPKKNQNKNNNSLIVIEENTKEHDGRSKGSYWKRWSRKSNNSGRKNRKNSYAEESPDEEYGERNIYQYENNDSKQDKTKFHVTSVNKKTKHKRNKEDKSSRKLRDKEQTPRRKKSQPKNKKPKTSVVKSKKVSRNQKSISRRIYERKAQQTTLEDIIKDLVSGQVDDRVDKTYTVTMGKIHDKPFTKVKIIDCSRRIESDNSSASLDSPYRSPHFNQGSSNSTVFFLKPVPTISLSPTCSSNFARSGEMSLVNVIDPTIAPRNHCRVSSPERYPSSQVTPPSPPLLIVSPIGDNALETRDINGMKEENKIKENRKNAEHCSQFDKDTLPKSNRQRKKQSKFTIKFSRKVYSFFRRSDKKNIQLDTVNNSIINRL